MIYTKTLTIDQFTPVSIYGKIREYFGKKEPTFLFESVINRDSGSYSYITVGARETLIHKDGKSIYKKDGIEEEVSKNPLLFLKEYYKNIDKKKYQNYSNELHVNFIDGFIGYVGYDMVKEFEPTLKKHMLNLKDNMHTPDLYLVRPKLIIAYSHKNCKMSMITNLESIRDEFDKIEVEIKSRESFIPLKKAFKRDEGSFYLSKDEFFKLVERSKEMIRSGDVFQILMSNRYTLDADIDPFSFYRALRTKNPSPYLFLLEFEEFSITGSSPEVMVQLQDNNILLRPIAGTRKRGKNRVRDIELEVEMLNDKKEIAEHIMLVDLGRNDVGRVAKPGSVKVSALMRVERYSHVMHMVSDVDGELESGKDMFDLFCATFTAGTMTGAPKVRAMELIADFEALKRGFYSGSIGYFSFNGNMDSAITIRSALIKDKKIYLQAGAGVVADSKPELEFLEVQNKLGALLSSIDELSNLS